MPYTQARWEAAFAEVPDEFTRFGATRDVRVGMLALGALARAPVATLLAVATVANAEVVRRLLTLRPTRCEAEGRSWRRAAGNRADEQTNFGNGKGKVRLLSTLLGSPK